MGFFLLGIFVVLIFFGRGREFYFCMDKEVFRVGFCEGILLVSVVCLFCICFLESEVLEVVEKESV